MICVVDYGMGNLRSVAKALEKMGGETAVSSHPEDLKRAEQIVLPGVGAFGDGIRELRRLGLFDPLRAMLLERKKPFFGICLGMQLLFEASEESPGEKGLAIFKGRVQRFRNPKAKVPHMGWNELALPKPCPQIFSSIKEKDFFYFVHSFYAVPREPQLAVGTSEYEGETFAATVGEGLVWATQFHPEKSQEAGLQILKNFISL